MIVEKVQARMKVQQLLDEWHEVVLVYALCVRLLDGSEKPFQSVVGFYFGFPKFQEGVQLHVNAVCLSGICRIARA